MKKTITLLLILAVIFAAMQFVRPSFANPPVTQDIPVPDNVKNVLRKGCYDCHSNQPQLKWFDKITPANFLVAGHITAGRKVLNFSNWDSLAPADQKAKLFWAVNDIRNGTMPLGSYLAVHGAAALDSNDVAILEDYLMTIAVVKPADSVARQDIEKQYEAVAIQQPLKAQPEFNGIDYISGWENWKAISTTDRFDNGSMRIIYGNDVAVKAIEENHINPWPEGTVFAKAAWKDQKDKEGNISTGAFWQVEFMIKDSKKYAATRGWGWGRWRGTTLTPYGKDASFTNECTTCHEPMKSNDFVFSYPLHLSSK
ncbi:cytochrome P460 family protein [Chitinophagaceae bacterium MMS25-I14]